MTSVGVPHKPAEGREAEVYAWDERTVLRLLRDPAAHQHNERQRAALIAAAAASVRVPAVGAAVTYLDRPGLVMERIDGPDLLTLVGRQPWRVLWAAGYTARVHGGIHQASAPESLPPARDAIHQAIARSPRVPDELRAVALELLAGLPDSDRLLHGDFHPGNLILGGDGPVVIDWTNAARGHPDADLARTILLLRLGDPPPGTSPALPLLALVGRQILLSGYLRAYRRVRRPHPDFLGRWEFVQAAERLTYDIAVERPKLLRLLRERRVQFRAR